MCVWECVYGSGCLRLCFPAAVWLLQVGWSPGPGRPLHTGGGRMVASRTRRRPAAVPGPREVSMCRARRPLARLAPLPARRPLAAAAAQPGRPQPEGARRRRPCARGALGRSSPRATGAMRAPGRLGSGHCGAAGSAPPGRRGAGAPAGRDRVGDAVSGCSSRDPCAGCGQGFPSRGPTSLCRHGRERGGLHLRSARGALAERCLSRGRGGFARECVRLGGGRFRTSGMGRGAQGSFPSRVPALEPSGTVHFQDGALDRAREGVRTGFGVRTAFSKRRRLPSGSSLRSASMPGFRSAEVFSVS